jgi:hypothetical protein
MIKREELLFVEELIAALKILGRETIPFADEYFHSGVRHMQRFIAENQGQQKEFDKIRTLFVQRPISGSYDRMIEALQRLNGRRISFSLYNPSYERAVIRTSNEVAHDILTNAELGFPEDFMLEVAKEFCEGAGL